MLVADRDVRSGDHCCLLQLCSFHLQKYKVKAIYSPMTFTFYTAICLGDVPFMQYISKYLIDKTLQLDVHIKVINK